MAQLNSSPLGLTFDSLTGDPGPDYPAGEQIPSKFNHPNNNTIVFTPWPDGSMNADGSPALRRKIHGDEIYDSTLKNIIDITDKTFIVEGKGDTSGTYFPLKLKAMDFAYLKNVGVYPNNRLMIARRFGAPVGNDPLRIAQNPISTMVSWVPEGQDFLTFDVGEDWTSAEADFTKIFNELGGDVMTKGLGTGGAGGAGAVPLPGFTEIFQRKIMTALGLATPGSDEFIPSGEPNLIKEAKRRQTIGYDEAGSTLKANISIKMVCEWEQKFIGGIDPSVAWMDILNMVLRFGTSPSIFYLGETKNASSFKKFVENLANNPLAAINDMVKKIKEAMVGVIDEVKAALDGEDKEKKDGADKDQLDVLEKLKNIGTTALSGLAKKYKVRLIGVTNALTGAASTPWHITIGNPMRPVFCSGDMLVDSVSVTLGPDLAFNDLPSSIKAEFTLKNARNLGMQEILSKFNVGYLRTVTVKPDIYKATVDAEFIPPDNSFVSPKAGTQSPPVTNIGDKSAQNTNFAQTNNTSNLDSGIPGTGVSGTGDSGETKIGNLSTNSDVVNPDANSSEVLSGESNEAARKAKSSSQEDLQDRLLNPGESSFTIIRR